MECLIIDKPAVAEEHLLYNTGGGKLTTGAYPDSLSSVLYKRGRELRCYINNLGHIEATKFTWSSQGRRSYYCGERVAAKNLLQ